MSSDKGSKVSPGYDFDLEYVSFMDSTLLSLPGGKILHVFLSHPVTHSSAFSVAHLFRSLLQVVP